MLKAVIVKINGYSKLLLFYLSFEVDGSIFYLRAWSNTLPCLIVGGGRVISRVKVFSPILKWGGQNKMMLSNIYNSVLNWSC